MDPWSALNIERSASADDIKMAYRKLAREHHTDLGGDPDRFRQIQQAYEQLTNPQPQPHQHHQQQQQQHNGINLEDLFRNFGINFGQQHRPQRNHNLEMHVIISVVETINGASRTVNINENGVPRTIQVDIPAGLATGEVIKYAGMGSQLNASLPAGDLLVRITVENPLGYVVDQGHMLVQRSISVWRALLGTEVTVQDPLGSELKVTVPAGVTAGTRLRVAGRGGQLRQQRGDIIIEITITMPELSDDQTIMITKWL